MSDAVIVASFAAMLQPFVPCFTGPSYSSFVTLMCGWVLNLRRHTVTQTVQAANAVEQKHISSFHRFFSRGRWLLDEVSLTLAKMIISLLVPPGVVVLVVDDTLGRHTGKRIAAASMHRDPLLSTGKRPMFHWGHVWVVLAIHVDLFGKSWALPVLFRLHRSHKRCLREHRLYRKTTEHAREMVERLVAQFPDREFLLLGDAAYTNSSLIKGRPKTVTLIGRGRLDSALFAPPPKRRGRGRPRVRGKRLPSPQQQARSKHAKWKKIEVEVYGKTATVRVLVMDALWYVAAGGELMRLVLVRGFPGHDHDDVFVSTDTTLSPRQIIEAYSRRWSLEVTFHDSKGKLGLEDPQNRTEHAVERTAPMALIGYSLIVLWYTKVGHGCRAARLPAMPWYDKNGSVTFSDMLATVRRASWAERLFDPRASASDLRKTIRPLVDYVSAAA